MRYLGLLTLVFSLTLSAQNLKLEKPNYKKIKKEISKKNSDLYYSKLIEKYLQGDSTFTMKEKRHLYYGYIFQKSYSPYGRSEYNDSISKILQKNNHDSIDMVKIIYFSDFLLADNPFNLRAINYQIYAFENQKNWSEFNQKVIQSNIIVDALLSSGDGLKKKTAFYVINTSHEYDLLNILGFTFGGEQSLIEHYDYLKLGKNQYNIKGLYFDVSPCLNSLKNMF